MSKIGVTIDGRAYQVDVNLSACADSQLTVTVNGEAVQVVIPGFGDSEQMEWIVVGNRPHEIAIDRDLRWIKASGRVHRLQIRNLDVAATHLTDGHGDGQIKAPVPGLITRVLVGRGDQVQAGQPILVLEAMKMENEICAPCAGVIDQLNVQPGQSVSFNEVLATIA